MKVSIITVAYNSSKTILDTIHSVNKQDYSEIEHILIDGSSRDDTVQLFIDNSTRVNRIVSEKDKGIYDAMNKGILLADGDIIALLNSDDYYLSQDVISKIVLNFKKSPIDGIYTDMVLVEPLNHRIKRRVSNKSLLQMKFETGWHPPHPALFVKKSVYQDLGLFNLEYELASDFEWMYRVFRINSRPLKHLKLNAVAQRLGGASTASLKTRLKGNYEIIRILRSFGSNWTIIFQIMCGRTIHKLWQLK